MATKLKYYILSRYNPQTGTYYLAVGQKKKSEVIKRTNNCIYGSIDIHGEYTSESFFQDEVNKLKLEGEHVY